MGDGDHEPQEKVTERRKPPPGMVHTGPTV
jgi:hypothetical protein